MPSQTLFQMFEEECCFKARDTEFIAISHLFNFNFNLPYIFQIQQADFGIKLVELFVPFQGLHRLIKNVCFSVLLVPWKQNFTLKGLSVR